MSVCSREINDREPYIFERVTLLSYAAKSRNGMNIMYRKFYAK